MIRFSTVLRHLEAAQEYLEDLGRWEGPQTVYPPGGPRFPTDDPYAKEWAVTSQAVNDLIDHCRAMRARATWEVQAKEEPPP
ncbi:unnamed protein product [marine sediment metagenome]|uniref:DinB-like domain-containing protein n=1 Tax=marine sediment metagenome TaxID=412755 RepID=X1S4K6_9ZZZZ